MEDNDLTDMDAFEEIPEEEPTDMEAFIQDMKNQGIPTLTEKGLVFKNENSEQKEENFSDLLIKSENSEQEEENSVTIKNAVKSAQHLNPL